ncbi:hypothetical protein QQ045_012011 [Rhodiola kirilowii]
MTSLRLNVSRLERFRSKRVRKSLHCTSSEADLKKEKRMLSNRIAAAKSHARKQVHLETLESKVMMLTKENKLKQKSLQFLKSIPKENINRFQLRSTSSL